MSDNSFEQRLNTQAEQEFGKDVIPQANEAVEQKTEAVVQAVEAVEKSIAEDIPATSGQTQKIATKQGFLTQFSQNITNLLSSNKAHTQKIPDRATQEKRIKHTLEKEQSKLIKQMKKLENSRNYSANKLETLIAHIRQLQKTIKELFYLAIEQLEGLYRKVVLKQG